MLRFVCVTLAYEQWTTFLRYMCGYNKIVTKMFDMPIIINSPFCAKINFFFNLHIFLWGLYGKYLPFWKSTQTFLLLFTLKKPYIIFYIMSTIVQKLVTDRQFILTCQILQCFLHDHYEHQSRLPVTSHSMWRNKWIFDGTKSVPYEIKLLLIVLFK